MTRLGILLAPPSGEELDRYQLGTLSTTERSILQIRLSFYPESRRRLNQLNHTRRLLLASRATASAADGHQLRLRPAFAFAALVVLLSLAVSVSWLVQRNTEARTHLLLASLDNAFEQPSPDSLHLGPAVGPMLLTPRGQIPDGSNVPVPSLAVQQTCLSLGYSAAKLTSAAQAYSGSKEPGCLEWYAAELDNLNSALPDETLRSALLLDELQTALASRTPTQLIAATAKFAASAEAAAMNSGGIDLDKVYKLGHYDWQVSAFLASQPSAKATPPATLDIAPLPAYLPPAFSQAVQALITLDRRATASAWSSAYHEYSQQRDLAYGKAGAR